MKKLWIAGLCVLLGMLFGCTPVAPDGTPDATPAVTVQPTQGEDGAAATPEGTVVSQPNPGANMEQAREEAVKQLEGKNIAPDQCYDFVFRSVVFRYYPYQEFASLAEVRRVFPGVSLPQEIDGCALLDARLTSLDYNELAVETLPSSDKVGQIYDLPPRAETINYAKLVYRADDGRRILIDIADKTHMPTVAEELFQYDGQVCVLSDQDKKNDDGTLSSVTLMGENYAYTVFQGVDGPEVEGKTTTMIQGISIEDARALLDKIPFDAIVLQP